MGVSTLLDARGVAHPRIPALRGTADCARLARAGALSRAVRRTTVLATDSQLAHRRRRDHGPRGPSWRTVRLCHGPHAVPVKALAAGDRHGGLDVSPDFRGLAAVSPAAKHWAHRHVSRS